MALPGISDPAPVKHGLNWHLFPLNKQIGQMNNLYGCILKSFKALQIKTVRPLCPSKMDSNAAW